MSMMGSTIPFAATRAQREAAGDPRPSIEERYPSLDTYYNQVRHAVDGLVKDRLLLCEDADDQIERLVQAGLQAGVPPPNGDLPPLESEHCHKPPKSKSAKK